MKVKIISDSTSDLSPELVKKYDISIVPLYVVMGDKIRKDGIEATPEDIYEYVSQSGKLPKTSAPNLNDFLSAFRNWRNQGYEIVHFNISSDFSSSHATARMAAEEVGGVEVVDTRRCSSVAALGANLLKLKPCIEVTEGKMQSGKKFRGTIDRVIINYVTERLQNREDIDKHRIFITHTRCSEETVNAVRDKINELQPGFEEILETTAGCTVTSHCGPGTLGVLFIRKA